jgi:Leucine-rich repeat (LRR) protein
MLRLENNRLRSFDVGEQSRLTHLYLSSNKLSSLNLRNNCTLTRLDIDSNEGLREVTYLPPSLEVLNADWQAIISFDFSRLPRLRVLQILNGRIEKQGLRNLLAL